MRLILMLASSVFASLNPTLAKVGFHGVNSNLSTGVFWLCYYKAMQIDEASKVVFTAQLSVVITMILAVLLRAYFISKTIVDCSLIAVGTFLMVL